MTPYFSIIIPARDEEKHLPHCLASIEAAKKLTELSTEIILVNNRSTDRTAKIAIEAGCKIVESDAKNLSIIRNEGVKAASGEVIITVDADSQVSENMLLKIHETLTSGKYLGGGVMIYPERYSLGIIMTGIFLAPFVVFLGVSCGLFFCKKDDFWAIGGFDEDKFSAEDIDFALRLKKHAKSKKKRFKNLFSAYIVTSCRKFDSFGDWYLIKNPFSAISLLRGRNKKLADKLWYDYEH